LLNAFSSRKATPERRRLLCNHKAQSYHTT
jgi:hypothetical protein